MIILLNSSFYNSGRLSYSCVDDYVGDHKCPSLLNSVKAWFSENIWPANCQIFCCYRDVHACWLSANECMWLAAPGRFVPSEFLRKQSGWTFHSTAGSQVSRDAWAFSTDHWPLRRWFTRLHILKLHHAQVTRSKIPKVDCDTEDLFLLSPVMEISKKSVSCSSSEIYVKLSDLC